VVGAITKALNAKEEAKRMKPMPGMVAGMSNSILRGTATVTDSVVGSTVGEPLAQRLCASHVSPPILYPSLRLMLALPSTHPPFFL
jgi:hypothetical protein